MQKMAERHGSVRGTVGDWQSKKKKILDEGLKEIESMENLEYRNLF
jgi:hypothetical protein